MLDKSTFEYLAPRKEQLEAMDRCRAAAKVYADALMKDVPQGPDRTYILRKLREIAMWANVSISRSADGAPRP